MDVPRSRRIKKSKDKNGNCWEIEHDKPYPSVTAWWSRTKGVVMGKNVVAESFVLRQVNDDDTADTIIITLGQLYDLIDVANQAVEDC